LKKLAIGERRVVLSDATYSHFDTTPLETNGQTDRRTDATIF